MTPRAACIEEYLSLSSIVQIHVFYTHHVLYDPGGNLHGCVLLPLHLVLHLPGHLRVHPAVLLLQHHSWLLCLPCTYCCLCAWIHCWDPEWCRLSDGSQVHEVYSLILSNISSLSENLHFYYFVPLYA